MEPLEERIRRVLQEEVAVVAYDPQWVERFRLEREHLLACLPTDLVRRVEHFGSTAVPGLSAKPIIDILVEVADLGDTRLQIVPILESQGYEYFWRPTRGDDQPPFYAWFIKRDEGGRRTHHLHMVEAEFREHWDRLLFRDYLIAHPEIARQYQALKIELASRHVGDRLAYGRGKAQFIDEVTAEARRELGEESQRARGSSSTFWQRGSCNEEETKPLRIHYLEIVTNDVDAVCVAYGAACGSIFGEPDSRLGNARTAKLQNGGLIGVRAPLHETEQPTIRPYWLVDDIDDVYAKTLTAGAQAAHPPMQIPGHGTFAIFEQGGVHHGLWQLP